MQHDIKTVGSSGQISLGKQYAGRTVIVEQPEEGVWVVRTAQVIPDKERWLHTPKAKASLDRALAWSAKHPRKESDFDAFVKKTLATHKSK